MFKTSTLKALKNNKTNYTIKIYVRKCVKKTHIKKYILGGLGSAEVLVSQRLGVPNTWGAWLVKDSA